VIRSNISLIVRLLLILIACSTFAGSVAVSMERSSTSYSRNNFRSNNYQESKGLAPDPELVTAPVIQIYSARTWGVKKALAVHTWIATKRADADEYIVSQIIGWRLKRHGTALFKGPGTADKDWHGNPPTLLLDLRGSEYASVIDDIDQAIAAYPYANEYTAWPGPNSNTFIAWLGLEVPELGLDLPSTAIGKDWRPISSTFGLSASGSGVQGSLYGLLGVTVGIEEGLEVNLFGLSFELDIFDLAIELPGVGRIGASAVTETQPEKQQQSSP